MSNARKFQLNTSKLFLTYPQCNVPKEDALALLQGLVDVDQYVVAHELHANGDDHLHVYLSLSTTFRTTRANALDLQYGDAIYHGNYQGCRSAKNVLRYCTKHEDYISNFDVSSLLDRKSSRAAIAEALVLGKRSLEDLVQEYPTLVYDYQKVKTNMKLLAADLKKETALPDFLPNPWSLLLPSGIQGKKRHYWIFSRKPNVGKTYLFGKPLVEKYDGVLATGFAYWGVCPSTRLLVLDDYNTAALGWASLNQLADNTYNFRIFMGGYCTPKNYIVVVLSNRTIQDLYPNTNEYLYERFIEICVDKSD